MNCITPITRVIVNSSEFRQLDEDIYLGVKQLSQYMMGTYFVEMNDHYVYEDYNEQHTIVFDKGRLVKTPGYEILISDIDSVSFEVVSKWIYINVIRDDRKYRFVIGSKREKVSQVE